MRRAVLIALLACNETTGRFLPDASTAPTGPCGGNTEGICSSSSIRFSCVEKTLTITETWSGPSQSTCSFCRRPPTVTYAYCSTRCTVEVRDLPGFGFDLASWFCLEAPEAVAGKSCIPLAEPYESSCLPTRAQLAADGTVVGQNYLDCVDNQCVAGAPPVVDRYLQACDAETLSTYGSEGALGFVITMNAHPMCLLAWDAGTQTITSGVTKSCIGDWDCPAGSLCDDTIAPLSGSTKYPVCKPGPRGTLTPEMLSP